MTLITDYTSFADAQTHCTKERLWELFDGDRENMNIAHECVDRHPRDRVAVRIAQADGGSESITFGELSDWSGRYANYLRAQGIGPGERVALLAQEAGFRRVLTARGASDAAMLSALVRGDTAGR